MERKLFLEKCQKSETVQYDGNIYKASAYKLWYKDGHPVHTAVLLDIPSGSIREVLLERLE